MKPDGVDLINALEKAITLIYTILNTSTTSTRNSVVPWDTIHRWENLVKYARKESELEIELNHYKQEAKKIPNICLQKPCYFDLMNDGERDKEFVFAIAKQMCPQICPKWNGGGQ